MPLEKKQRIKNTGRSTGENKDWKILSYIEEKTINVFWPHFGSFYLFQLVKATLKKEY